MKWISTLRNITNSILLCGIVALLFLNLLTVRLLIKQQEHEISQNKLFYQITYSVQQRQSQRITSLINNHIKLIKEMDSQNEKIYNAFKSIVNIDEKQTDKLSEPDYDLLIKATVQIFNRDRNVNGSGICINYKGQKYILSAYHLDDSKEIYVDDGGKYIKLELVLANKQDDLILFKTKEELNTVKYINFVKNETHIGEKIWICGNPSGLVDTITNGIVIKKNEKEYLTNSPIFFGSSGGGAFNKYGELIGIVSQMLVDIDLETMTTISYSRIIDIEVIERFLDQLKVDEAITYFQVTPIN